MARREIEGDDEEEQEYDKGGTIAPQWIRQHPAL
jgi:hypothetical protein